MKKKPTGKLALSKETLRSLTEREMIGAQGGIHTDFCTSESSNPTLSETCFTNCTRWCQ